MTAPAAAPGLPARDQALHRPVSFTATVRAEALRTRRTFTRGVVPLTSLSALWAVMVASAVTGAGLATAEGRWAGNVLAWLSVYPFGLALPTAALAGAMNQWREQRVRGGGTMWLPLGPRQVAGARALVLACVTLACQLAWLLPVLLYALATGAGWGPADDYLALVLLEWVATTAAAWGGMLTAQLLGGAAVGLAPAVGLVWGLAGAVQAESASWLLQPWTWGTRPALPLMGVHGNSVNLEPGAAAWDFAFLPGVLLQAGLGAVVLAGVLWAAGQDAYGPRWHLAGAPGTVRRPRTVRPAGAAAPSGTGASSGAASGEAALGASSWGRRARLEPGGRSAAAAGAGAVGQPAVAGPPSRGARPGALGVVLGLGSVLPWGLWTLLAGLLVGMTLAVRQVYGPHLTVSLLALLGVPVAATVVGVSTWVRLQRGWRGALLRAGPLRALGAALVPGWLFLAGVLTLAFLVAQAGAGRPEAEDGMGVRLVYLLLVLAWVVLALELLAYALAQSCSVAVSVAVTVLGLLASLLIAGNTVLSGAPGLWLTAPWGWVQVAGDWPQRWPVVVLGSWALAAASLAAAAWSARPAALREEG